MTLQQSRSTMFVTPTYKGVQYPLREDGILNLVVDELAINAGLYQLLQTEPSERLMELSFGTPLRDLLFEMLDNSILEEASRRITASIAKWETRIYLPYKVTASTNQENKNEEITPENSIFVSFSWQFKSRLDQLYRFNALVSRSAPLGILSASA